MREIKFRGRSLHDEKQWVYGLVFKSGSEGQWTEIQTANGATCYVDPETIGQYTGIKDKNGVEIYEGDIVSWNKKIGYISFLKQEMGYRIILKNTDVRLGHRNVGSGYDFDTDIEVIGNICENQELLEGE